MAQKSVKYASYAMLAVGVLSAVGTVVVDRLVDEKPSIDPCSGLGNNATVAFSTHILQSVGQSMLEYTGSVVGPVAAAVIGGGAAFFLTATGHAAAKNVRCICNKEELDAAPVVTSAGNAEDRNADGRYMDYSDYGSNYASSYR